MKIQINERESYHIELQEEIKGSEFFELLNRLQHLAKLIGKDFISQVKSIDDSIPVKRIKVKYSKQNTHKYPMTPEGRIDAVELMRKYYTLEVNELKSIYNLHGYPNRNEFSKYINYLKQKFKIISSEIGLVRYPLGKAKLEWIETK